MQRRNWNGLPKVEMAGMHEASMVPRTAEVTSCRRSLRLMLLFFNSFQKLKSLKVFALLSAVGRWC